MNSRTLTKAELGFESVGVVLRRLRFDRESLEQHMTAQFDRVLSLQLDAALLTEESCGRHGVGEQELTT